MILDKKYKRFLFLAAGGILTGLTLVFPVLGFFEWLTLVPVGIFLFALCDDEKLRKRGMYGYGFFFFMCYYTVVFHWFINLYPLDFIDGMTAWAAIVVVLAGCIGLSALQALFGGLLFLCVRSICRTKLMRERQGFRPFAIAALWAIYEWTQNLGWWGVPWGRLPIGQSKYIVGLQTASLFGSYFVTFLLVAVNMCVAYALINRKALRSMAICIAAVLLFNYGVGTALYFIPVDSQETLKVAAVQGNIASNEKWSFSSTKKTLEVYKKYTLEAAEGGAQIIVWPETAFPYDIVEGEVYGRFCSELAREANAAILVGGFTYDEEENSYNSLICVLPDGSFHDVTYSKRRLVPFGEFVPMRGLFQTLIPPLAELVMSDDDIAAGEGAQIIDVDGVNIGSLICFDSIYDGLARSSTREGANFIALGTNDSWFTDSAALYMHNAQAQMRAIENGRYVVRAANTGISTLIDSKGNVLECLPPLEEGMIVGEVCVNTHRTLYSHIGNGALLVFGILLLLAPILDIKQKIIKKSSQKKHLST